MMDDSGKVQILAFVSESAVARAGFAITAISRRLNLNRCETKAGDRILPSLVC
jgi:hypothetical protein